MSKIIITCAVTGSIHTPSMSPYLPVTAEAIAGQAIAAAKAGAAILHLHARDPHDGRPSAEVEDFMAFLPAIRAETDAVINLTTGGSAIMTMEQRLAGPLAAGPEMCSLNMGTMNFALYPMLGKRIEWLHDWEEPFLRNSDDLVFKNTPRDIECVLTLMGQERGARFEFECYDLSHLHMLHHFVDRGLVKAPVFIQFVMGVLGGVAAEPEHLAYLKQTADGLFGDDYMFSVLAAGRQQMPMARLCASMGGHVRVGLEDNLYIARGELATSNAEQVEKVRDIVEAAGRVVATPDETRAMLGLKGSDKVGF
ncbi:MAG: 3-keto-5-aminohexanoate cleavage protein [Hoeflea sp.]|uniref:3-keto-5-aminohexanoate cleavage protein n=1 Tax=Hoeflea sp. TaxID=1940281 RepID=UPI001D1FB213|nr:3-keto-5-aminohexanoate cleavage protein [Hoeflea sp.]MBU4529239.1 3-keto-5-aminohexanoate cleavage protein [Alphaproteobacteria bacterium]MBU4543643.1 3-keto-5-aminohexanoate cleavage protein [Alphaproteobacteria bacterium]MBU4549269.1 3-keto-5-aminohexanoate cleavage protein [Alphaproteobacteria bacterium]MBV1725402.1 3-keto-5-aminohexanoate cleavage protein [Hoeflea sp.]MBV1785365.1 3-keto-5-aminohexanoate cleavage protein [Hoeflea sp.]